MVLAIDPGPDESALIAYDADRELPTECFFGTNEEVRYRLGIYRTQIAYEELAIEFTPPYTLGGSTGRAFVPSQVVTTAIEIGRFMEAFGGGELVSRIDIKKHLLGRSNGTDAMVNAAIVDRYGGTREKAKGTKKAPGPLHGFKSHLYAALAVAVTYCETRALSEGRTVTTSREGLSGQSQ